MRLISASSLALVAICALAAEAQQGADELKKLEGTWNLIASEQDGMTGDPNQLKSAKLVIKGNKMTVYSGKLKSSESTIVLHPTRKPKGIDATQTFGGPKGTKYLGIYSLEDDTLKICFGEKGRPNNFSAKKGSKHSFDTWKRAAD